MLAVRERPQLPALFVCEVPLGDRFVIWHRAHLLDIHSELQVASESAKHVVARMAQAKLPIGIGDEWLAVAPRFEADLGGEQPYAFGQQFSQYAMRDDEAGAIFGPHEPLGASTLLRVQQHGKFPHAGNGAIHPGVPDFHHA